MAVKRSFSNDLDAVSAQIAVILMVAVVVVVAVAVLFFANLFTEDVEAPEQLVTFAVTASNSGGSLIVQTVPGGPLDWSELGVSGSATCVAPTGEVGGGDEIVCTSTGWVTISDISTNTLVFSWEFR